MTLMTRTLIGAVTALAILALTAGTADATHSRGKCKARGETIAKNDTGRVYEREEEAEVRTLWGCTWERNRPFVMDVAEGDGFVTSESYDNVILRGRFVAWTFVHEDISCKADCPPGYDPDSAELRVANLRTRRIRTVPGELGEGTALVVTRTGAIAWIQPGSPVSVRADDADGSRVLYAGDDIHGGSLSLSGSTVAWVAGGQPMSAVLR